MARREEGAYWWYATDEQRSQPGWIGAEDGEIIGSSRNVGDFLRSPREVADRTNSQLVVVEFSADS